MSSPRGFASVDPPLPSVELVETRYGSGAGCCSGRSHQAASSAASGVTQALTEVANDLPRNGPRGTYSHAWMSRADQSLRPVTPKTWSASPANGTAEPSSDGAPTTKPSSASMSSRLLGPYVGAVSSGAFRCPEGRVTGVPETTTVPARPW